MIEWRLVGVRGEEAGTDGGDRRAARAGDRARSAAGVVGHAPAAAHDRRRTVVGSVRHQPPRGAGQFGGPHRSRLATRASAKRSAASTRRCRPSAWRSRLADLARLRHSMLAELESPMEPRASMRPRPTPSCARTPSTSSPTSSPRWPPATTASGRRAGGCRRGPSSPTCSAARCADGTVISPKYVGQRRLIEIAVATLATDRALLLLGVPGTAKTWVSEHLAAAISGDSTLLVQGTAGTAEESAALRVELRPAAGRGPERGGAGAQPGVPGDARRGDRAGRGAHPHAQRRAGRVGHDALREDAARARAGQRGAGGARASTSSPRPTTATAASTICRPPCAAGSTPSCCRCRPIPTRRSPSSQRRVAELGRRAGACRRCRPPTRRSAGSSPCSASCAAASPRTAGSA